MTIRKLAERIGARIRTGEDGTEREIAGGYCCDILSNVLSKGKRGMAWITIQTHMNVVAAAALTGIYCVVAAEGMRFPDDVVKKAAEEGICLLESGLTAFEIAGRMQPLGARGA